MNFWTYIGKTREQFETEYLKTSLVDRQSHDTFPLDIYCYGRKAVFRDHWDDVTSKCRGIVVNRETGKVIARPFEKFHNLGSTLAPQPPSGQPFIMEKVDGFMCTLYEWEGKQYIASKGSFHSTHAKWATAWLRCRFGDNGFVIPKGHTAVFEGLHKDLRIVVDYGDRQGLVLLAVIHNETGAELWPHHIRYYATKNNIETAVQHDMTLGQARQESLIQYHDNLGTEEGYVAVWYNTGAEYRPPVRLKIKFVDYLRLHRMVCGVTPWRIWEALANGWGDQLTEWLDGQNRTPWFTEFVQKWVSALQSAQADHLNKAREIYEAAVETIGVRPGRLLDKRSASPAEKEVRRRFAVEFMKPENQIYSAACFKLLDREDPSLSIWKYVERMTERTHPLRDGQ